MHQFSFLTNNVLLTAEASGNSCLVDLRSPATPHVWLRWKGSCKAVLPQVSLTVLIRRCTRAVCC